MTIKIEPWAQRAARAVLAHTDSALHSVDSVAAVIQREHDAAETSAPDDAREPERTGTCANCGQPIYLTQLEFAERHRGILDQESKNVGRMILEGDMDGLAEYTGRHVRDQAKRAASRLKLIERALSVLDAKSQAPSEPCPGPAAPDLPGLCGDAEPAPASPSPAPDAERIEEIRASVRTVPGTEAGTWKRSGIEDDWACWVLASKERAIHDLLSALDAREAENARLRTALDEIATRPAGGGNDALRYYPSAKEIARAALDDKEKP
jgi:hypothetical protein